MKLFNYKEALVLRIRNVNLVDYVGWLSAVHDNSSVLRNHRTQAEAVHCIQRTLRGYLGSENRPSTYFELAGMSGYATNVRQNIVWDADLNGSFSTL
jgi:hypothetical protein